MATLAPAYTPRRPTETVLYGVVREQLETFLRWTRETYDKPLPRYVEEELRAYLRCGVFAHGFVRMHCDACGHDLLVAFSCKGRSMCPSCAGRRMANTAAHLVDRVLPDVPVRQFVLSLPFELRPLAAFKADVLTALSRILVEAIFVAYRKRARADGLAGAECGAVTFVQRFGSSLNLNVHFHVVVLDGAFTRAEGGRAVFHASEPPRADELFALVERVRGKSIAWLRRRGMLDESALEDRSNEAPSLGALDGCAAFAMARGTHAQLPSDDENADDVGRDAEGERATKVELGAECEGFNLHAGVHIAAGDDLGRERLCRYGARPSLALDRLRRLPGGRVAYRIKYARRGRAKHRVMTGLELLARLAALIPPPRYPLVRYHGVLAPKSSWRTSVVPKPRGAKSASSVPCARGIPPRPQETQRRPSPAPGTYDSSPRGRREGSLRGAVEPRRAPDVELLAPRPPPSPLAPEVERLAPNILSVQHWERLLGGALYAATPRLPWAQLLRRTFDVDVLACVTCGGRLRVLGAVTAPAEARGILAHLGLTSDVPPTVRARDPTEDVDVEVWAADE